MSYFSNEIIALIILVLLFPLLLVLINHPFRIVRFVIKVIILIFILIFTVIVPLYILYSLKYWFFIPLVTPILFRIVGIIIEKLNYLGTNKNKLVRNLMYSSIASLGIIFTVASNDSLEEYIYLILITFILFLTDFKVFNRYHIIGTIFGPIIAFFPTSPTINTLAVVIFFFGIITICIHFIHKLLKKEVSDDTQKIGSLVIILLSVLIISRGGITLNWEYIVLKTIYFISLHVIFFSSINYLIKLKLIPKVIEHFLFILYLFGFNLLLYIVTSSVNQMNSFFIINTIFTYECFVLVFFRIISLTNSFSSPFHILSLKNIKEILVLFLGSNLFNRLESFLFGYERVSKKQSLLNFLMISVTILSAINFIVPRSTLQEKIFNSDFLLTILAFNSVISSLTFILVIEKIIEKKNYSSGLPDSKSIKYSTLLTIEYLFILAPIIYWNWDIFKGLGLIFFISSVTILVINTNIMLSLDMKVEQYNNLYGTRLLISSILQIAPIIYALAQYIINLNDIKNDFSVFENTVISISSITFWCTFAGKLIGYDSELASQKHYFYNLFTTLPLIIFIIPFLAVTRNLLSLLVEDPSIGQNIFIFIYFSVIILISKGIGVILLPYSNKNTNSIYEDWMNIRR